jgi:CubicO group peptidase (beta-lactamase class C family)
MKLNRLLASVALASTPLIAPVAGAGAAIAQPADFRARADAILAAAYPADGPGAMVVVTRRGRVIYSAGRGLADIAGRRPIGPDTVFRLGSLTKQFTAAMVLQLVQEGRISLDDPVSRFFPDYPQPGARATVRQLLNHTSGIQSYTAIPGFMAGDGPARARTTAEMIAMFRDLPSPTPPGQVWAYNNSGYVLLGAIVEQVTGKPWHRVLAERITGPLGLRSIGYGVEREALPGMARGYSGGDSRAQAARVLHMSVPHAAGALVGTAGDMARWAQALHHGRVVSPALYAQMIAPAPLPEGRTHPYGMGLGLDELRGRRAIEHSGGIFGFSTYAATIPSEDIQVVVLANSDDAASPPRMVTWRLAALALSDPFPEFSRAAVPAETLAPLLGVYRIDGGSVSRRFFARDGRLWTQRDGGQDLEVFPAGGGRFFYGPNSLTWFKMTRGADGVQVMEMYSNGATTAERAVRTGDVPAEPAPFEVSRAVLQSYAGRYATGGPVADIVLREDGVLTVQLSGQEAIPMRAVSATEFVVQRVNARVVFHPENGQANRLVIHQGGRQIEARRVAP